MWWCGKSVVEALAPHTTYQDETNACGRDAHGGNNSNHEVCKEMIFSHIMKGEYAHKRAHGRICGRKLGHLMCLYGDPFSNNKNPCGSLEKNP